MQTLIWIKSPSWVWSLESSFCLFLVNVTDLSASVAQKPLEAICSIFPPPQLEVFPHSLCRLKWSGSQIITVVECHHAACPTPTLMCVCARVNEGTIFETNEGEIERIKEERRQTRTCPDITPCRPETTREFVLVGSARILLSVSEKSWKHLGLVVRAV